MSNFLVIIIAAVVAVGLFVLGLSLTLIFKGHNIQSEIGENPAMKARGIKCTVQAESSDNENCTIGCGDKNCSDCESVIKNETKQKRS